MKMKTVRLGSAALAAFCACAAAFIYDQGNRIESTQIHVQSAAFPAAFSDFRLAHVSDLHGKRFGKKRDRLAEALRVAAPDIIVLTGDIVDEYTENLESTRALLTQAAELAPIYYVHGNHDRRSPCFADFEALLDELGAVNLERKRVTLTQGDASVTLGGAVYGDTRPVTAEGAPDILLTHSPDGWESRARQGGKLILCGHKHGGQIALPGGRALAAPDENGVGFFPAYASGLFKRDGTAVYVSRGLGTSVLPLRLFARPELAVITLG